MVRADSLKFEVPESAILDLNLTHTISTTQTNNLTGQTVHFTQFQPQALPVGVSSLKFKAGGNWIADLSAKTLGADYLEGITYKNLDRVLDSFSQFMRVDPSELLDSQPKVFRIDSTQNILLDSVGAKTQREVFDALQLSHNNPFFTCHNYNKRTNQGIEFRGSQEQKNRLIAYDKFYDLQHPKNKEFRLLLGGSLREIEALSKRQVRVEVNHTNLDSIRKRFGVSEPTLQEVLLSPSSVNYDFLLKVTGKGVQHKLYAELERAKTLQGGRFTPNDLIFEIGIQGISASFDYNFQQIKTFFKTLYPDRTQYNYWWNGTKNKSRPQGVKSLVESAIVTHKRGGNKFEVSETRSQVIVKNLLRELKAA